MYKDEKINKYKKTLSKNLYYLKEKEGLSQQEITDGLNNKYGSNFDRSLITRWINGQIMPTQENLNKIADFFGISFFDLVNKDLSIILESKESFDKLNNGNKIKFVRKILGYKRQKNFKDFLITNLGIKCNEASIVKWEKNKEKVPLIVIKAIEELYNKHINKEKCKLEQENTDINVNEDKRIIQNNQISNVNNVNTIKQINNINKEMDTNEEASLFDAIDGEKMEYIYKVKDNSMEPIFKKGKNVKYIEVEKVSSGDYVLVSFDGYNDGEPILREVIVNFDGNLTFYAKNERFEEIKVNKLYGKFKIVGKVKWVEV